MDYLLDQIEGILNEPTGHVGVSENVLMMHEILKMKKAILLIAAYCVKDV